MVIAERAEQRGSVSSRRCEKCGGYFLSEHYEQRIVCLNCGAQEYYGLPKTPEQVLNEIWFAPDPPSTKYIPQRPGAIITLGGGSAHYVDNGCKEASRCQDCPLLKCCQEKEGD